MPDSDEIKSRLARIETTLARIEGSLAGDAEFGNAGLFKRVAEAEKTILEHSNIVLSVKAKMLGALMASTMIGGFLNWLLGLHYTAK